MPLDPHAQFDHSVLEMIEQSPIGAVPFTPAYRDAVSRLYASHQVYANADHKDTHVTARSLAGAPSFFADNLSEVIAGRTPPETLEANAKIFDRYVHSLAQDRRVAAETMRMTVAGRVAHHRAKHGLVTAHDPIHTLFLVPGAGPHPGLSGNYLYGSAFQLTGEANSPWAVHLHDSGDGIAIFDTPVMAEALGKIQELIECAPFAMTELAALGFRLA
ncbi:MAG: hypothetical protein ABI273_11815 [Lacunisphaera sp.]